ncbi:MAG: universal stress protein [Halopseudomonas sp.]
MFKRLCVATDGSSSSQRAVKAAAELANKIDASLLLVHVIREMKVPEELKRYIKADALGEPRHEVLQEVGEKILSQCQAIAVEAGVSSIKSKILDGDPALSIVNEARSSSADLIVLGTRGLGKIEGMFIGSVSRKIADISDISVLIIK